MNTLTRRGVILMLISSVLLIIFIIHYSTEKEYDYITAEGVIFGTTYHITYQPVSDEDMTPHIQNAFDKINNSLSMFNPLSTIAKINNNEDFDPDSLVVYLWKQGRLVSEFTSGYFDMTVAPLVNLWGFGLDNRRVVKPQQVDSVLSFIGYDKIDITLDGVKKSDYRVMLDASAIAKGFACDVVADTLASYGIVNMCVEIGGELVLRGVNSRSKEWNISINTPDEDADNQSFNTIAITDCGMATSGNYRNYYEEGGIKYAHTIDPHTGYPVQHDLLSATIIAPTCLKADAIATACMSAGLDSAVVWVERDTTLRGYFIYRGENELLVKKVRLD